MSLKDELEQAIKAERDKLREIEEQERDSMLSLRVLIDELVAAVDPKYLAKSTIEESRATIEMKISEPPLDFVTRYQWEIRPIFTMTAGSIRCRFVISPSSKGGTISVDHWGGWGPRGPTLEFVTEEEVMNDIIGDIARLITKRDMED